MTNKDVELFIDDRDTYQEFKAKHTQEEIEKMYEELFGQDTDESED